MTTAEEVSALQQACARLFVRGCPTPTLGNSSFAALPSLPSFSLSQVLAAVEWQWRQFKANPTDTLLLNAEADNNPNWRPWHAGNRTDKINIGFTTLELSDWTMHFADIKFTPRKGNEPNAFHRLMQRLVLGIRWERTKRPVGGVDRSPSPCWRNAGSEQR